MIASKGHANYLLKKASVLSSERHLPKKYEANFKEFIEYKIDNQPRSDDNQSEENKNPDDMENQ